MAVNLTPVELSLRARTAANARWAKPGARQRQSQTISASRLTRHECIVDPEGRAAELRAAAATRRLSPPERDELRDVEARTENSLRAEMARIALKASKARRKATKRAAAKSRGTK
jgi:hypothetical protein